MSELVQFAREWGPWVALILYFVYKLVPSLTDNILPEWAKSRREAREKEYSALVSVYERMITSNERTVTFISSAAEALRAVQHALDDNTRVLASVVESVRQGVRCPLPDCPFMHRDCPSSDGGEQPGDGDKVA